jgi:hypothetical protein
MNGVVEMQGVTGLLAAGGGVQFAVLGATSGPTTGPSEVMPVTGGAGFFRNAAGEPEVRSYCSDPSRPFRYDRAFCIGF